MADRSNRSLVLPRHRGKNGEGDAATAPVTLLGLGPPEPPEELGDSADTRDVLPETLRPWATSCDSRSDAEDVGEVPFVPLAPLFPRGISPPFRHAVRALGGPSAERRAPQRALWIPVAVIAVGALTSTGLLFVGRSPLRSARVAAGPSPSTTPVADPVRAEPPAPEVTPERPPDARIEELHAPVKAARTPSHRVAPSTRVLGNAAEPTESSVASDPARIRAVADTVRLDDDDARAAEPEAVAPEEAAPEAR